MNYSRLGRVGYITPSDTLETPAYEFFRMAPEGVVLVSTCLNIARVTPQAVEEAWRHVEAAARRIAGYKVDLVVVGGGPLAYLKGPGADRELGRRVTAACGVPSVSEITVTVDALRTLHVRRLAIASPFTAPINQRLKMFFEDEGFVVVAMEGLGLDRNVDITLLPVSASYEVGCRAVRQASEVDALYITCPRWPVAPNLESLERDLGVPVVASMQSILWAALRHLRVSSPVVGYGRLLRTVDAS